MAIERWEGHQPAEQLVAREKRAWRRFFGEEKPIANPPQEFLETLAITQELGWTTVVPISFVEHEFTQHDELLGWKVKPVTQFWQDIREGKIRKDEVIMRSGWVLLDITPKPDFQDGLQFYPNDPFGAILARLREQGRIAVPKDYQNVPPTSRFALKYETETGQQFMPELARILKVDSKQVTTCPYLVLNVIGNRSYSQLGRGTSWELFDNKFDDKYPLLGGGSDRGGLAHVCFGWPDDRSVLVGFRPLVVFPS